MSVAAMSGLILGESVKNQ